MEVKYMKTKRESAWELLIAGNGIYTEPPKESRVNLFAQHDGVLKINEEAVQQINDLPLVICATLPNNTPVTKGQMLAGTKVIPLVVNEADIAEAERVCREAGQVIEVKPYKKKKSGVSSRQRSLL